METAYFKDIRQVILKDLNSANQSIKVAVAWFTNQDLFDKLCEKVNSGLDVEVIIIDDYINNGDYGLDFQEFINLGGKLRYGNLDNPMHHKFCVIDSSTLITGSYNWTYYAESRNEENVVLSNGRTFLVKQYVQEFERLKSTLNLVDVAVKRSIHEIETFDYFNVQEYLGYDLYFGGKQNSKVQQIETAARLLPNNRLIQQEYKKIAQKKLLKKTITSLGIEAIVNGVDGFFSVMIKKGTLVPCRKSGKFYTSENDQTSISVETYKGCDNLVVNNQSIGAFIVNDLPPKPEGKASITVTFKLSAKGVLTVAAKNNETGSQMEANYDVEKLVF